MDSDSTDATADVAAEAGAKVYRASDVAPGLGTFPGKGEALWKSLLVTSGDLLVFVDADLTHWGPHFVTGLLGPLLADPRVLLVKGFYERLRVGADGSTSADGGRVTELVARPLLSLWWPGLAGVVQPLAGEWAVRRELMESLPVPVGYGVELAALLDTARRHGLDAIAQVDLGRRGHRHQASHDLAVMAAELLAVAERRRPRARLAPRDRLHQFVRADGEVRPGRGRSRCTSGLRSGRWPGAGTGRARDRRGGPLPVPAAAGPAGDRARPGAAATAGGVRRGGAAAGGGRARADRGDGTGPADRAVAGGQPAGPVGLRSRAGPGRRPRAAAAARSRGDAARPGRLPGTPGPVRGGAGRAASGLRRAGREARPVSGAGGPAGHGRRQRPAQPARSRPARRAGRGIRRRSRAGAAPGRHRRPARDQPRPGS